MIEVMTIPRCVACVALAALVVLPDANAQDTVRIESTANANALYRSSEALLAEGSAEEAYARLSARESELSGEAYFDYLLGVAALDSGRRAEAILHLRRAVDAAPQFSGARMELARALFEAGEPGEARPLFEGLLNEGPPPDARIVIERYIAAINRGPAAPAPRFMPYAEIMSGFDTNANGSTDNQDFLGFALSPDNVETDSAFIQAGVGFNWFLPSSARFAWTIGFDMNMRNNPDASFVDSSLVRGTTGFQWRQGAGYGRVLLDMYATTRDGESNERYLGGDVMLGRRLNEHFDVTASLRYGALHYNDSIEILDVDRLLYRLGLAYNFASGARAGLEAVGGEDDERLANSPYGNSKSGGRAYLSLPVSDNAWLFVSGGAMDIDYDGLFFGAVRDDTQTHASLSVEFRDVWTEGLAITPNVRFVDNDSDISLYNYDRTEFGIQVRWSR